MEKISNREALDIAYENLYSSPINKIDRNLDHLLQIKKTVSLKNGEKSNKKREKTSIKKQNNK